MRDVMTDLVAAVGEGRRVGLVTVVGTFSSAPRPPGASMAVIDTGEAVGSVSGGCIEGAVYELAREVIDGRAPTMQRYGVSDDDAFAVGLTCGGTIDVFVEPVDAEVFPELTELAESIAAAEPVAVATVVSGPGAIGSHLVVWPDRVAGSLGGQRLDDAVADDARGMLDQGRTGTRRYGADGERRKDELEVFVQSFAPPPRMLVFGAIDFAAAVVRMGKFLGYHVTVCDARPVFATERRFPEADEVVVSWPHDYLDGVEVDARTVICVLTHDPKFDVPLLESALRTPAAYIGVMGSRRTHADRLERLRERGVSEADLERMFSPVGLDIGARTPEETAVSIAAEIIATRWGGTGRSLRDLSGPIHHDRLAESEPAGDGP
ncbi:XdhC/CoxI family protein [Actinobacteria bacterium YIM 96077]|uniref:XshC-Cox1 family protein n=1 Tax=Phytoactinopolyspora halophila TaxID=1981511 RepID=A0A329QLJ0_9ACTN|nr:XdhC/CoxI family protein [Phytoactinopolyspora halophila]AYY12950.1 XdhC/CoxI family protein [Actinobacteria bacterium YIM 96077]RAW13214.1 XshC-Cox1 family protein [Phytoactinopolyspora halophila]